MTADSQLNASPASSLASESKIELKKSSLADVRVDVLVNVITCKTLNLAKAGAVSSSLLTAAGSQLQTVSTQCF